MAIVVKSAGWWLVNVDGSLRGSFSSQLDAHTFAMALYHSDQVQRVTLASGTIIE